MIFTKRWLKYYLSVFCVSVGENLGKWFFMHKKEGSRPWFCLLAEGQ